MKPKPFFILCRINALNPIWLTLDNKSNLTKVWFIQQILIILLHNTVLSSEKCLVQNLLFALTTNSSSCCCYYCSLCSSQPRFSLEHLKKNKVHWFKRGIIVVFIIFFNSNVQGVCKVSLQFKIFIQKANEQMNEWKLIQNGEQKSIFFLTNFVREN